MASRIPRPRRSLASQRSRSGITTSPPVRPPFAPSPSPNARSRPHPPNAPPRLSVPLPNSHWSLLEKKRREAIRFAFDRLTTLVPGLEGQGRSEGVVLQRTAEFLHEQLGENLRLADELETRGGDVPEHLKM